MVLLACFSLFRLSSIFFTEFRTSDTVSKYLGHDITWLMRNRHV
jgi:hypothetical protein